MDFESIDEFDDNDGPAAICVVGAVAAAILATAVGFLGGSVVYSAIAGLVIGSGGAALLGWRKVTVAVGIGLVAGATVGGITWWICSANSLDIATPRLFAALIGGWMGLCFAIIRQDAETHEKDNIRDAIPMALLMGTFASALFGGIAWGVVYFGGWLESDFAIYGVPALFLFGAVAGGFFGWQVGLAGPHEFSYTSDGSSWGSFWDLSDKQCSNCGRSVSLGSEAGQRCPHCGAYWSSERTIYRGDD